MAVAANQRIKGSEAVRLRVTLEQLVRASGDAGIEIRLHPIGIDETVNALGIPLIPGADDELMRGDDGNRNFVERIDIGRGGGIAARDVDQPRGLSRSLSTYATPSVMSSRSAQIP